MLSRNDHYTLYKRAHLNYASPSDRQIALISACNNGILQDVRVLLENGADPNHVGPDGWTPLTVCAYTGFTDAISLLLEHGANIHKAGGPEGWTPLEYAANHGDIRTMNILRATGKIDIKGFEGCNALRRAFERQGNIRMVHELLRAGVDVHKPIISNGMTSLMFCSLNGFDEMVECLLSIEGIAVNDASPKGWTPLMLAANNGHTTTVNILAANGADINQTRPNGHTAFSISVMTGHVNAMHALVATGKIDITGFEGRNALLIASQLGNHIMEQELMVAGAKRLPHVRRYVESFRQRMADKMTNEVVR